MSKPLGLKTIAWWFIIAGFSSILLVLVYRPQLAKEINPTTRDIIISVVISLLFIISGIGLLGMKKWAWFLGLVIESLTLIYQLLSVPALRRMGLIPAQTAGVVVGLIVSGVIITYLLRQDVRELFGVTKPLPPETGGGV